MIISSNFGTSIHTLLIISECSKTQRVTSEFIANILGISPVLIRRLFGTLKKAGFISVAPKKAKEGTRLARPLGEITLFDIFKAVEPDYLREVNESCVKFSNRTHAGIFVNEIISGYVEKSFTALANELKKTTLDDTLTALKKKEAKYPNKNTRELFPDL